MRRQNNLFFTFNAIKLHLTTNQNEQSNDDSNLILAYVSSMKQLIITPIILGLVED